MNCAIVCCEVFSVAFQVWLGYITLALFVLGVIVAALGI